MLCARFAVSLLAAVMVMSVCTAVSAQFVRVCYYTSWSRFRVSPLARFDLDNIDLDLCTHLVYAFGKINTAQLDLTSADPINELEDSGRFRQFTKLKERKSGLKTLLSIGGETKSAASFHSVTASDMASQQFAQAASEFLQTYGFDGLDLDWEYPTAETKEDYVQLLKALREAFDQAQPRLILTAAVAAGEWTIDAGYDAEALARYADLVNVMTYDYHVVGSEVAAFNSPLYSRASDPRFHRALSVNYTVHYWHSLGLPYAKMAVGVTPMGRRYILKDASKFLPGDPVQNTSEPGPLYFVNGGLAYPEICELRLKDGVSEYLDPEQAVPYLVYGDTWVGFERPDSARRKVDYMVETGVAGFMVWSLDQDDFTGNACGDGEFPILTAMLHQVETHFPPDHTHDSITTPTATPTDNESNVGDNDNNNSNNNNGQNDNNNNNDDDNNNNNDNNNNGQNDNNNNDDDDNNNNVNDRNKALSSFRCELWSVVVTAVASMLTHYM